MPSLIHQAQPLPIDNLTVLDLLNSLQLLQVRGLGGGPAETRRLSFRALAARVSLKMPLSLGASLMPGMVELGEDIFLKPVRRGVPKYASALHDMVAQPRRRSASGALVP